MSKKRKIIDAFLNSLTWLAAGTAVVVLGLVVAFVFRRGFDSLSWDLIRGNYWSENINVTFDDPLPGSFERPGDLPEDAHFSNLYGIAVRDAVSVRNEALMEVVYIAPDSNFRDLSISTSGEDFGKAHSISEDASIRKVEYFNAAGDKKTAGLMRKQDAETFVEILDTDSESLALMFYQTSGGGIWGSLKATLMLIGLTLVIVLPVGIAAAIYLNEVAKKNKITGWIRTSIEMLSGVPSIIFGLMGLTMLFPITKLFGAQGHSILLGALTMSVVLLPVVIRQTEEALRVVPMGMRMGSLALGANQTQTIFKVVLPNALPGILSAALLSMSRIIGESAALIFTMSTIISDNPKVLGGATSLAVQIWAIMSADNPNFELASAISIIILVIVLVLNVTVKLITHRLNRKWN